MAEVISLEDYIKVLKRTVTEVPNWALDQMLLIAKKDAVAVIARRVRNTGKSAKGGGFKPYSTKDTFIGAGTFTSKGAADKVLGSKKKRAELEWITTKDGKHLAILKGGYKKIREIIIIKKKLIKEIPPQTFKSKIEGKSIKEVSRRGKVIIISIGVFFSNLLLVIRSIPP